ncbi:S9 family peptidase [Nonomuraea mesophila]|uniref:S9 family peptidase n=1 Tax=Nonomuraea mesophila TaxID=2530382 RepID=A0A4R5FIC1_9ACTN|nr:S9 family peptidase [Nonomuraea mesophila]TDE51477.1 S9 family peptidase [Nonomuraea mesophila]
MTPANETTAKRPVVADDLLKLRFLMGADLAPDGRTVVYALSRADAESNTDHTDLYLLDRRSRACRRLTYADTVHVAPVFSPDGRWIAFLSVRGGAPQIFVMPADGGEARQLTSLPRGVSGGPAWSPDGRHIAFAAGPQGEPRDPAKPYRVTRAVWRVDGIGVLDDAGTDICVVEVAGGEPLRLTDDAALNFEPVWTSDGTSIAYLASHDPGAAPMTMHLRMVGLDGGVSELAHAGLLSSHAACPDGRIAYLIGYEPGQLPGTKAELRVADPRTGAHDPRTTGLDAGVGGIFQPDMPAVQMALGRLVVSDDGAHAYTMVQRGGEGEIVKVALSGPESYEPVVAGERVCAPACLRGDTLLFAGFGMTEPGDLYTFDVAAGREERLTELNTALLTERDLPSARRLEFVSGDGATVEGWFLPPADGGDAPYPTVLGIHGGPHIGWGHIFNFDFLMLAGAGFGVLFVNQRGSTGYGDDFATTVNNDYGNLDYTDLMKGVDHAVELGLADPDRLGVFGISCGGFLTGWIIGHTDRFKAACPENPFFNWFSMYGTSDTGLWQGPTMMGGAPHERRDDYERCSPITYAHRCTTPTLFLQHEADHRCPPEQTEQYYAVLKANGVPAEMLRFPGTSHHGSLVGPPSHRLAQNEALLDWMIRYV